MKGKPGNPGLKGRLVDKSVEAYILALETINRLSIKYRVETFCYLICNAWELLLKAKILADSGKRNSIFYSKSRGETRRSLSLRDCLKLVIPNENSPERRNIERIAELRDEAVHLVFSEIPSDVLCLFQAGVLNYHKRLYSWFGISLSDRVPVGMMTIVYDMQPQHGDLSDKRLRRELGRDAVAYLSRFCSDVRQEFDTLQRPAEFSIGLEYHVVLTKKVDEADIVFTVGPTGQSAQVFEVAKDSSKTHPFRQKEVIEMVNKAIDGLPINQHDIQCVNKAYGTRSKPEYFYQGKVKGSPTQYSQAFVAWIIRKYKSDLKFFVNARARSKMIADKEVPK